MKVAILWHMHQPTYWDAELRTYRYPWAFLHASRHYHMMGKMAQKHPGMAMTINVTPSLMEQLQDYSGDVFKDRILEVVRKPASELDENQVRLLLDHVFKINARTMVDPFPRYRELRSLLDGEGSRRVRPQEILDLQTLYLLTWLGYPMRGAPEMAELYRKGKHYTEEEKALVFSTAHLAVRDVLPLYGKLQELGKVEISTTPYYHPILPLLIDCDVARESRPDAPLDGASFRFPQDARWHVTEAKQLYEGTFGSSPRGMWPAEGSISDDALAILAEAGLLWAASDEGVLARSLRSGSFTAVEKHRPYRFRDTDLVVYFRDHELSDRVGFVYSGWDPIHAADDLFGRLRAIRGQLGAQAAANACVSVILDGENCWEYYPDCGVGFLDRLYTLLESSSEIEPIRMGDIEARPQDPPSLRHVVPGSWIDANFDTWIGGAEKNRAWSLLSLARRKLAVEAPDTEVPREIYRAQGSDWFWWLGPGHDTPYEASYENLFRTNLIQGLCRARLDVPEILRIAPATVASAVYQPPTHLFTPTINGRRGNYYDWIAAGRLRASAGSIHRTDRYFDEILFGFDKTNFYLRAIGRLLRLKEREGQFSFVVEFDQPRSRRVIFRDGCVLLEDSTSGALPIHGTAALENLFELSVPLADIGGKGGDLVEFSVALLVDSEVVDSLPASGNVLVRIPTEELDLENWSV